jgi:site-specific DNA recombinase
VNIEYALTNFDDSPEGRLSKHIRATIAEYEREKITERTQRGKRSKIKAGNVSVAARPPYGYRIHKDGDQRTLVIYEPEEAIVRAIFGWYEQGDGSDGALTLRGIAHKLTHLAVPTHADIHGTGCKRKRGPCYWCIATVSQMLKNETHAGSWAWGKRWKQKNGRWTRNPEGSLLTLEVPAIVARET